MRKIKIWYLLLCSFMYAPIYFKNYKWLTYIIVYIIPLAFFSIHLKWVLSSIKRILNTKLSFSFIIMGIVVAGTLLIPIIHKTFDFTYFSIRFVGLFKMLYRSFFLLLIYEIYVSKEKSPDLFIKYFIYSCCAYILVSLFFLFIPSFKTTYASIIAMSEIDMQHIKKPYYITRFAWNGFAGFSSTIWCTISAILNIYLIVKNIYNRKQKYSCYYTLFILLLGNLLYARTGMLISVVCLTIMLLALIHRKIHYIFVGIILIPLFGILVLLLKNNSSTVQVWYDWFFSFLINFKEKGTMVNESLDILFNNMYFIPSFFTLIVGNGQYTMLDGSYYMNTDSGILRPILFYGLFFSLLLYFSFFYLLNCIQNKQTKPIKVMIINIVISLFLFEIKGESIFLFWGYFFPIVMLFSRVDISDQYKSINKSATQES